MSEESDTSAESLPDGCAVFRAIKPSWLAEGRLLAVAFIRSPRDLDGLSASSDKAKASETFQRQRGVAELQTGRIRTLGSTLNVVADPTERDSRHALITGLPFPYPDPYSEDASEKVRAQQYAERLLGIAAYPA